MENKQMNRRNKILKIVVCMWQGEKKKERGSKGINYKTME